jgi:hypothetical protein
MLWKCNCCGQPGCCVHYCNKLCCQTITFTFAFASGCGGSSGTATVSVGNDCYADYTLTAGECAVTFRVKVTCSGYNADQDCDTDCTVSAIEYLVGGVWTETMPSALASLTAELDCGEQAEAQYATPRCAAVVAVADEAACDVLEGVYCPENPTPCQECALACGPLPTEWRIVSDGVVWFAGDIILNPAYTGGNLCSDPWADTWWGTQFETPRLIMVNYPASAAAYGSACSFRWPSGWPEPLGPARSFGVQVLGCDGANWQTVYLRGSTGFDALCVDDFLGASWPSGLTPCSVDSLEFGNLRIDDTRPVTSPPGCSCMVDPATGQRVTVPGSGNQDCCRQCNAMLTSTCGSGLEYLGHGMGVRFTGAVDEEGTNLWNWEDADGNSPAGFLPGEYGWANTGWTGSGTPDATPDIVIAGAMRGWRPGVGYGPPTFRSVTLEPGAVLAVALTTETLVVDDAAVEDWSGVWASTLCSRPLPITVTGTATFKNGAANSANYSPLQIVGNCVFEDDSSNDGTITGNVTASGTAVLGGTINGDATLSGSAQLTGTVTGTATFTGSACNSGGTAGTFVPNPPPAC